MADRVDFSRTDPETTEAKVRLLTSSATYFNTIVLAVIGGRVGSLRAEGLVEQVVAAAFQTSGGEDPHPSPFEEAAMLPRGITQGHPLTDGNKRTGFLVASCFLELHDMPIPPWLDGAAAEDGEEEPR